MKPIKLDLSQVLSVAWVWQREIVPRYLPLWTRFRIKSGMVRKPVLHLAAYNSLLEQLCSGPVTDEIRCTKGALSMLAANSAVLSDFNPKQPRLRKPVPGLIAAEKQLVEPSDEDKADARELIRKMLSVDGNGKQLYIVSQFIVYPREEI